MRQSSNPGEALPLITEGTGEPNPPNPPPSSSITSNNLSISTSLGGLEEGQDYPENSELDDKFSDLNLGPSNSSRFHINDTEKFDDEPENSMSLEDFLGANGLGGRITSAPTTEEEKSKVRRDSVVESLNRMGRSPSSSISSPLSPSSPENVSDIELAYIEADLAFQQGRFKDAERKLKSLLNTDPSIAKAHCLLSEVYYSQDMQNILQAKRYAEKAISLNSHDAKAHFIIGVINYSQSNFGEAAQHLQDSSFLDPTNIKTLLLLGDTRKKLAQFTLERGDTNAYERNITFAEDAFQKVVDQIPNNLDVNRQKAIKQLQELRHTHEVLSAKSPPIQDIFIGVEKDVWRTIIAARYDDNLELIQDVIKKQVGDKPFLPYKGNVNGRNSEGWTVLQVCAGSLVLVKLLVETYKADVNIQASDGGTALTAAATLGKSQVIEYLAANKANFELSDKYGENIFHRCARDHWSVEDNPRNLVKTVQTIFRILREQDRKPHDQSAAQFQVSLLEGANKSPKQGTNLLLQLLTQKNKAKNNQQTPIELADSLEKSDLAEVLRQELSLLINERLSGLIGSLFCSVSVKGEHIERPLFAHDPKRASAVYNLYNKFLTTHLSSLPTSFFCSNHAAFNSLTEIQEMGIAVINLTEKEAKRGKIKTEHREAAIANHNVVITIINHGKKNIDFINSLLTNHMLEKLKGIFPIACFTNLTTKKQPDPSKAQSKISSIIAGYAIEPIKDPSFLVTSPKEITDGWIFEFYKADYCATQAEYIRNNRTMQTTPHVIEGLYNNFLAHNKDWFKIILSKTTKDKIVKKFKEYRAQVMDEIETIVGSIMHWLQLEEVAEENDMKAIALKLEELQTQNKYMCTRMQSYKMLASIFDDLCKIKTDQKDISWLEKIGEAEKEQKSQTKGI